MPPGKSVATKNWCRIKSIELEAPAQGAAEQQWTSDITLAYLSYAPKAAGQSEAP